MKSLILIEANMDIKKSLNELDLLYEKNLYNEVEKFLLSKIKKSKEENDRRSEITLLNELMGFYRTSSRYKELIDLCDYTISLLKEIGLEGTVAYATTALNVATAYREVGKVDKSLEYYSEVLKTYRAAIPENDMRFASLYNNMSIACNEKKHYEEAFDLLEKALAIVVKNKGTETEEAITYSNMTKCLMKMNRLSEASDYAKKSLLIFEKKSGQKDFHYSASLSAMGELQFLQGNYEEALKYFNHALSEIENTIGINSYYAVTLNNISSVYDRLNNKEEKDKYKSMAEEIFNKIKG